MANICSKMFGFMIDKDMCSQSKSFKLNCMVWLYFCQGVDFTQTV